MPDKRKTHGLHALKARSWRQIDRRSAGFRAVMQWKNELLRDLGGAESVSAQQMALLELIVRSRLFLDHVDCWLLEQASLASLVNKRRKSIIPALKERQALVDSLARLLGQLGLKRVAKSIPALAEYVRAKETQ